jgi:phosphoethanolamine N-methyltransferase
MSLTDEGHYGPKQLNMLKIIWGEGYLSPGGSDEIDEILGDIDLTGKKILDIGCGCGGAAFHMLEKRNAAKVIGFDVEKLVIDRANESAVEKDLSNKTSFQCVTPGSLQIDDESIDVIFSKEAFIHVEDKKELMKDIHRVLKPNGYLAVGDWMRNDDNSPSKQMREYIAAEGLDYFMCSLDKYRKILEETGFKVISMHDRNQWYLEKVKRETAEIEGPLWDKVVEAIGLEEGLYALDIWKKLVGVVEKGEHRPGNFRALKI